MLICCRAGIFQKLNQQTAPRLITSGNRLSEQIGNRISSAEHNSTNQLTKITPGGAFHIEGTVNKPADATVNGINAQVDQQNRFKADVPLEPGQREIAISATDGNGTTATKRYQLTVEPNGNTRELTYDLDGNMLDDGEGKTYSWDSLNRLVKIEFTMPTAGQPSVIEFAYNGVGQRVRELHDGVVVKRWLWAGGYQPAEERDGQNRVTKRYYGALGEQTIATNNTATSYYYTTDHLSSIREMLDASGTVRARYTYDPFGRRTKVQGDLEATFGFTGHLYHTQSELNLTWYRQYDSTLGRWLGRDPIGERGGVNLYGYVGNNFINYVDILGLIAHDDIVGIIYNETRGLKGHPQSLSRLRQAMAHTLLNQQDRARNNKNYTIPRQAPTAYIQTPDNEGILNDISNDVDAAIEDHSAENDPTNGADQWLMQQGQRRDPRYASIPAGKIGNKPRYPLMCQYGPFDDGSKKGKITTDWWIPFFKDIAFK